jgi:hypothetical protein
MEFGVVGLQRDKLFLLVQVLMIFYLTLSKTALDSYIKLLKGSSGGHHTETFSTNNVTMQRYQGLIFPSIYSVRYRTLSLPNTDNTVVKLLRTSKYISKQPHDE